MQIGLTGFFDKYTNQYQNHKLIEISFLIYLINKKRFKKIKLSYVRNFMLVNSFIVLIN